MVPPSGRAYGLRHYTDFCSANASTRPNSASASTTAKPKISQVRLKPADSGWRALAWMYAAKTMPTPMPGPMAARPYPMVPSWPEMLTAARRSIWYFLRRIAHGTSTRTTRMVRVLKRWCESRETASVLLGQGALDIAGRQHGEHVCLQHDDHELEERHDD